MKNYIILSAGFEWCYYCWKPYIDTHTNVWFYKDRFPVHLPAVFMKVLIKIYHPFGYRLLRFLIRPILLRRMPLIKVAENIVIIYDWNYLATDIKFLQDLRKRAPNLKLIYVFTNIVKITGANKWGILGQLKNYFDAVFAFDKQDAVEYGFHYNRLIYAKPSENEDNQDIDLFYVGKAKDRLGTLLEVFKQAKEEGLRCDFTIVDVPEDQQLYSDCINYNSKLSYDEVIKRIRRSRCLVDVIQGGSTGLTIKTVEAVMYGRKLLTTNQNVVNEAFYNSQNILVYDGNTSISSFLNIPLMQYTDDDKYVFSPDYLFSKIDEYCK